MKNKTVQWPIIFYLLVLGLIYVPTIDLWKNTVDLSVLHVDIPPSVSNAAFQVKALANFLVGIVLLAVCTVLFRRQDWGRPVTVVGLSWPDNYLHCRDHNFCYLNAMGAAIVVIPAGCSHHLNHHQ